MKYLHNAFRSVSPAVVLAYAIFGIICVMISLNLVVVALAYLATLSLSFLVDGIRKSLKRISWQLPVIIVFAFINCFFAQRGETVFLGIGPFLLHVESFVYGALMGFMVMSALNYFLLLSEVVSSDDALCLFSGKAPITSLATSMSLGLVPRLHKQEKEIRAVEAACTCARAKPAKSKYENPAKHLTHLLATSLEDSLIRADSMRARGWGFSTNRSVYRKRRMTLKSKLALAMIVLFGVVCSVASFASASCFQIYPHIAFAICPQAGQGSSAIGFLASSQVLGIGYLSCAAYFFLPHIFLLIEGAKWRQ